MPASARTIAISLFAVVAFLTTIHVAAHGFGADHLERYVRPFLITGEANVATWFISIMLFSSAVLIRDIAETERRRGERQFLRHWWVLAIGLLYISIDETAQIHELASTPLRHRLGTGGIFQYAWVVPALVIVAVFLVTYIPFLARLPARTRLVLILSGAVYLAGALGLEMIGGYVADYHPREYVLGRILSTLEEFLEMCGIVLLIHALLTHRAGAGHGPAALRGLT